MATLSRAESIALAVAAAIALGWPLVALSDAHNTVLRQRGDGRPVSFSPPDEVNAVFARSLFAPALIGANGDALPADAPELVGIVGRLGNGAVALVRAGDGTTRPLSPGESSDGWRLVSLSIDAAFFARGGRQVRVAMPAADDAGFQ